MIDVHILCSLNFYITEYEVGINDSPEPHYLIHFNINSLNTRDSNPLLTKYF